MINLNKRIHLNELALNVIYNERVKLFATFLNGLGVAIFAVGGFAPLVSSLNGTIGPTRFLAFVSAVCVVIAFTLHYLASTFLTRMRP